MNFSKQKYKIGFTIAELMVVMFILSVIVASALPTLTKRQASSQLDFIPQGTIVIWYGDWYNDPSSRPPGYVVCDGTNSTPDLSGKFVLGANALGAADVQLNANGSSETAALPAANIPMHTHEIIVADATHIHGYTLSSAAHSHTVTSNGGTSHNHSIPYNIPYYSGASYGYLPSAAAAGARGYYCALAYYSLPYSYYGEQAHKHLVSTTQLTLDHNHGSPLTSTSVAATHTHQYNNISNGGGSGNSFNIMPPFYALYYIMKNS